MASARSIEPVRLLGTTWYRRGPAYWARRIVLSLAYLLLAVGGAALTFLVVRVFWTDRNIPIAVAIVVSAVAVVATAWAAVITTRSYRRAEAGTRRPSVKPRSGVVRALRGVGLLVVAVACCVFITFGGMAATFAYSLRPEFFGEHQARSRMRGSTG